MNFFHSVEHIDWVKLWWIFGALFTFWSGLAAITVMYPAFDPVYKITNIILGAATGAALFAARGNKFVQNRTELPPQDGKP